MHEVPWPEKTDFFLELLSLNLRAMSDLVSYGAKQIHQLQGGITAETAMPSHLEQCEMWDDT